MKSESGQLGFDVIRRAYRKVRFSGKQLGDLTIVWTTTDLDTGEQVIAYMRPVANGI